MVSHNLYKNFLCSRTSFFVQIPTRSPLFGIRLVNSLPLVRITKGGISVIIGLSMNKYVGLAT